MNWFSAKKKFIIFLSLLFILVASVYVRREIFLHQAKELIREKLEESLMCKFSFGEIKPWVFGGLVVEDLEIAFPQSSNLVFTLKVDQAIIDYKLQEIFFAKQKKDVHSLRLISPEINVSYSQGIGEAKAFKKVLEARKGIAPSFPEQDFVLILENGEISFGQSASLLKSLHGRLRVNKSGLYLQDIKGNLGNNSSDVLKVYGELTDSGLDLTANLEHVKISDLDILTNLSLKLSKKPAGAGATDVVSGVLRSYGSVINNQPFPELSSSFDIQGKQLRLLSFNLGDSYDLRGVVGLSEPFEADLSLNFYQAALNELVARFTSPEEANFSGLLSGLIKATGPLRRLKLDGYLEARNGHLGSLDFISADINIKGYYPHLLITDSRICREQDVFFMDGEINLAQLERQDSLDVDIIPDKGMLWQGWDITRSREDQVHMSKDIPGDLKITFDAFMQDQMTAYTHDSRNELGLEYRIFGDKMLKLRLKKEEGILGFERRVEF